MAIDGQPARPQAAEIAPTAPSAVDEPPQRDHSRAAARDRGRSTARIYAALLVYAGILAALVAVAAPYRVGDGPEYMGMAQSMARLEIPIVNDPVTVEGRFKGWSGWDRARLTNLLEMPDGRFAYSHLWTYPLLVAAPMAAVEAAGLHPNLAFTITNGLLLLASAAVALPRIGIGWSALLFIGPIVWWVDKAHNEIFTFAFLVIAFSVYRQRPGIALVAIGAAASNYLPLAALLPAFAAFAVWRDRPVARMPSFWTGAAIGVALAALNPLFYLATLGRPIPLLGPYGHLHIPTMAEIGVPLWDLNMGLVTNFPALVVAVVVALALIARDDRLRAIRWDLVLVAAVAVPMIVGASQPWNIHTGGTFGMSRYGIWFIPLAIPVLRALGAVDRRPVFLGLVAASIVFTLWLAAPSTKHNPLQPNYAARRVWEHLPALENPLPEVFFETMAGREGPPFESQAGPGCAKVLVIDGVWPSSCPLPAVEIPPSGYWYANRETGTYTFVTAPLPGQRFDDESIISRTPRHESHGSRSP